MPSDPWQDEQDELRRYGLDEPHPSEVAYRAELARGADEHHLAPGIRRVVRVEEADEERDAA